MNRLIKSIPRWIVFQIDVFVCCITLVSAYYLRYNFDIPIEAWYSLQYLLPGVIAVKIILFYYTKSYAGIIKYTSIEDAKKIFIALTSAFLILLAITAVHKYQTGKYLISVSILMIDYFLSMLFMASFRVMAKIMYYEAKWSNARKINVIIYGAGDAGIITKKTLSQDEGTRYNVVAFVDDNSSKSKSMVDGVRIYNPEEDLGWLIRRYNVELVIIAIYKISSERKKELIDTCLTYGIQVRNVPPVEKWINGELSFKQIKDVNIEDVLGRDTIQIENSRIELEVRNKTILVTGAAGSIGSELARQIARYNPKKMILLDQAESPLYDLELELSELAWPISFETVIADVTNKDRMERIFKLHLPDIVFHAAAYKHVPVMEINPSEALMTNVLGTKVTADLAFKYNAKKFVMISTDKAVNPTNVMGASKRIAEIYIQSLNNISNSDNLLGEVDVTSTRFITTRFGNVLGSNGSVIPRFKKQIAEGGPVTITHPEVTRFFMTIPEACQLVLEAGAMGKGGEVFLFDMGKSIKIVDLAKKMIQLSGLSIGKDIQIVFTGLRPGEKLFEELLTDQENTIATYHPKIMIAKVAEYEFEKVSEDVEELLELFPDQNDDAIIRKMKEIVPEFISNNSIYERFDKKVGLSPNVIAS